MSVSEIPGASEIDPDAFERCRRAVSVLQTSAEDALLVDMARRLAPLPPSPGARPMLPSRPSTPEATAALGGSPAIYSAGQASVFRPLRWIDPSRADLAKKRRARRWRPGVSSLAPAGAALVGAALVIVAFGPGGRSPALPKAAPGMSAAEGQPMPQKQGDKTGVASSGAGAAAPTDVLESPEVEAGRSQAQPNVPGVQVSFGAMPSRSAFAPSPSGGAEPRANAPAEPAVSAVLDRPASAAPVPAVAETPAPAPPVSAVIDKPAPAAPIAPPPPAASQGPDSEAMHAASLQPDATATRSATDSAKPAPASDAAPPPQARPAARPEREAVEPVQPSAPKLVSAARPSRRIFARPQVGRAVASAPAAAAETRSRPLRPQPSAIPPAPPAPSAAPPEADHEKVDVVAHAFGAIAGALETDQGSASKAGDWALQFPAPKSEAEAKAAAARLNAKYARALNGATIGVQKVEANGETSYALRVPGLSKADAAALCERMKGHDCSPAK